MIIKIFKYIVYLAFITIVIPCNAQDTNSLNTSYAFSLWVNEPCSLKILVGKNVSSIDKYVVSTYNITGLREYMCRIQFKPDSGIVSRKIAYWKINGIKQVQTLPNNLIEDVFIFVDSVSCKLPQITVTVPIKFGEN